MTETEQLSRKSPDMLQSGRETFYLENSLSPRLQVKLGGTQNDYDPEKELREAFYRNT